MAPKIKSLIGNRYGRLTVVSLHPERKWRNAQWECRCDCGNDFVALGATLQRGVCNSCGCLLTESKTKQFIGKKYGKLTVIRDTGKRNKHQNIIYECLCDCGKSKQTTAASLTQAKTLSCGCNKDNKGKDSLSSFRRNTAHANRTACLYLAEINAEVDKIGIAFDLEKRMAYGEYTCTWFKKQMSRAQCWAVEQVALSLTTDYRPAQPYIGNGNNGPTEQRTGWVLEDVITMLNELCDECLALGWDVFYNKYAPSPQNV